MTSSFSFIFRKWKHILILTLFGTFITAFFGFYQKPTDIDGLIFISLGVNEMHYPSLSPTALESVQAADQFTESVQGWFKNPSFIKNIENEIKKSVGISARKQEKQNLIITFRAPNEIEAQTISQIILSKLEKEIIKYNKKTNSNFQIALSSTTTQPIGFNMLVYILVGFAGGMILAIILAYLYENLAGFVTNEKEIKEIFKKEILEKLPSKIQDKKNSFLYAYLEKINPQHIIIVGVNFSPQKINDILKKKITGKKCSALAFPDEVSRLENSDNFHVILCRLGKTRLEDMKKIHRLINEPFEIVILY